MSDARWYVEAFKHTPPPRFDQMRIDSLREHAQSLKPQDQVHAPSLIVPALQTASAHQFNSEILGIILDLLGHENHEVVEESMMEMANIILNILSRGFFTHPARGTLLHTIINLSRNTTESVELQLLKFLQIFLQWDFITQKEKSFALGRVLDNIDVEGHPDPNRLEMLKFVMSAVDNIYVVDVDRLLVPVLKLCEDPVFAVRKSTPSALTKLASLAPDNSDIRDSVLKAYGNLAKDSVWGVKKSCAEYLGVLSRCVTDDVRRDFITKLFLFLVNDDVSWVRTAAYAALGVVISSFVEPPPEEGLDDLDLLYLPHKDAPSGCTDEVMGSQKQTSQQNSSKKDEHSSIKEKKYNETTPSAENDGDAQTNSNSLDDDNSCNSMKEDKDIPTKDVSSSKKDNGNENDNDNDNGSRVQSEKSALPSDQPTKIIPSSNNAPTSMKTSPSPSTAPNPFAKATENIPKPVPANAVPQSRASSQSNSPTSTPPVGVEDDESRPQPKEKLSMMMSASQNMSIDADQGRQLVFTSEEADIVDGLSNSNKFSTQSESSSEDLLSPAVKEFKQEQAKAHELLRRRERKMVRERVDAGSRPRCNPDEPLAVPGSLLDHYISLAKEENEESCTDALNFCAYSFPAVVWTVGAGHFDVVRKAFEMMAVSPDWSVRSTIASGLHEVARIVGPQITDEVIAPIVKAFLKDWVQVRTAMLPHLSTLFAIMSADTRAECCVELINFKYDDMQNWRLKLTLAEQLTALCAHLTPALITQHVIPLFFPLLVDKAFGVRAKACKLSGNIICQYVCENDIEGGTEFVTSCKEHIFNSTLNQFQANLTFVALFEGIGITCSSRAEVFEPILPLFFELLKNSVANVRLRCLHALEELIPRGVVTSWSKDHQTKLKTLLDAMKSDRDEDVSSAATEASASLQSKGSNSSSKRNVPSNMRVASLLPTSADSAIAELIAPMSMLSTESNPSEVADANSILSFSL